MRTTEQILATYAERKKTWAPVMARRTELRDAYNGDLSVPLPELDRNERVAVANLISQGLDQIAMRVASVPPNVFSPALRDGVKVSEEKARKRRQAAMAWMEFNELDIKNYRRARRLLGYAAAPTLILPNPEKQIPMWLPSDPLGTYPAAMSDPDDMNPTDCISVFTRSLGYLRERYPEQARRIRTGPNPSPDAEYEILRYVDYEQVCMVLVGKKQNPYSTDAGEEAVLLETIPNRAGCCLAVVPQRITLDRPQSQFDQMIGLYMQQAMLMALEVIAVKKGVLPTTVIESFPNAPGTPELLTGDEIHPGWSGMVNIIKNGTVRELVSNPGYQTFPTIDRLERAQRLTGGVPSEFGGESGTNIRTGRRGDAVISATVDFTVQENQRLLARAQQHELAKAAKVDKAWFDTPKSFYVSWRGAKGQIDYTPSDIFEDGSQLLVSYSHAGSDSQGLTIGIGQLVGTGLMSTRSGQEMHPWIEDAEKEHDRGVAESIERAVLASFEARCQLPPDQGGIHPKDAARVMQLVREDKLDIADAIIKVDEEASERESSTVAPAEPGSPEAMPGIASGGEAGIQAPMPDLQGLNGLLMSLRGPTMATPAERSVA